MQITLCRWSWVGNPVNIRFLVVVYLQLILVCCCEVALGGFSLHRIRRLRLKYGLLGLVETEVLISPIVGRFKIEARLAVWPNSNIKKIALRKRQMLTGFGLCRSRLGRSDCASLRSCQARTSFSSSCLRGRAANTPGIGGVSRGKCPCHPRFSSSGKFAGSGWLFGWVHPRPQTPAICLEHGAHTYLCKLPCSWLRTPPCVG